MESNFIYVAPPGTPAEAINPLREAFAKVSKDPESREEAKKIMMAVDYTSAEEAVKTMKYLLGQPEDVIREFGKYIKFYLLTQGPGARPGP